MKPFDLEKALAGEPVVLRNGRKGYIKYVIDEKYEHTYPLQGYYVLKNKDVNIAHWTLKGTYSTDAYNSPCDIIGMWEDPKPKRYVNGIEVPEPVTLDTWEDGRKYWYVRFTAPNCVQDDPFYKYNERDERMISQGLVFKTKKGADAMAKALLNYKIETK